MLIVQVRSDYYRFPIYMAFAAHLLENAILVLTLGRAFGPYF